MLRDQVKQIAKKGSCTQKQIADYLLNNFSKIKNLDVKDIAQNTYTSQASVVRFSQKLGYKSWRMFIKEYIEEQSYFEELKKVNVNVPFDEQTSLSQILDNIATLEIRSLQFVRDICDIDELNNVLKTVLTSQRVVIFTQQPYYYLAKSFERKMLSIGKNIEVAEPGQFGLKALSMNQADCAIIVSYSGSEFIESVSQVKNLQKGNAKIIALTSQNESYLISNANCKLTIPTSEHLSSKITSYASEISINYLFDVLFAAIFQQDFEHNLKVKLDNSNNLEKARYSNSIEK